MQNTNRQYANRPFANRQSGFSLVELSIVVLIMGLILGGIAVPLAQQRDNARIREAEAQVAMVQEALEGYLLVNGSLPCPATPASGGLAAPNAGGCQRQHGFVPATTLDLAGSRNDDNLLLDPWNSPLRYSVTAVDGDGNGDWDFIHAADLRTVGLAALSPDLVVCRTAAGASGTACGSANATLTNSTPLVIYSHGKDWAQFSSADQVENAGANAGGGPSGASYRVAGNGVFVSRGRSIQAGNEYDDVIGWLPANTVYKRLVDAGFVP